MAFFTFTTDVWLPPIGGNVQGVTAPQSPRQQASVLLLAAASTAPAQTPLARQVSGTVTRLDPVAGGFVNRDGG